MNELIKIQLQSVKKAKLPSYDDSTTSLTIPRRDILGTPVIQAIAEPQLVVNNHYVIEIANYVIHPSETFTLAQNWNHNTVPPSSIMHVTIIKTMGKMSMVNGCAFDLEKKIDLPQTWCGWLPNKAITVKH